MNVNSTNNESKGGWGSFITNKLSEIADNDSNNKKTKSPYLDDISLIGHNNHQTSYLYNNYINFFNII